MKDVDQLFFDPDHLHFIPLGGSGEIGMNMNLYHYGGKWLIADMGAMFGDDMTPLGVEVTMPDPKFIEKLADKIVGCVITHGHEDHIGAIPWLWPKLRCPVFATPLTASMIHRKLEDASLHHQVPMNIVQPASSVQIGPFNVTWQPMTHSIPESQALVIRTKLGTIFHTGDWKFDPSPLVGPPPDFVSLQRIGDENVLAIVGDSTNALEEGSSGSEFDVRQSLLKLVTGIDTPGSVFTTCFSSNYARLETLALAAQQSGRKACLLGRSLNTNFDIATHSGYLHSMQGKNGVVSIDECLSLPPNERFFICTGCQGEPSSALHRLSEGTHPLVTTGPGDVVIFSSRTIPGNENTVSRITNSLLQRGVRIIVDDEETTTHVSGHPCRAELRRLIALIRPRMLLPVHGEFRHLEEHSKLAKICDVPESAIPSNGNVFKLAPGPLEKMFDVPSGYLCIDGNLLRPISSAAVKKREVLLNNGMCLVSVVFNDSNELLVPPTVSMQGLMEDLTKNTLNKRTEGAAHVVNDVIAKIPRKDRDNHIIRREVRLAVHKVTKSHYGKMPSVEVHIIRIPTAASSS